MSRVWLRILFNGEDISGVASGDGGVLLFLFLVLVVSASSTNIVSFVGVLRPLRLAAEAVMSLSARLEAPILPPRSRDDFGVKNLVKVRGVIVGAFRGLLQFC